MGRELHCRGQDASCPRVLSTLTFFLRTYTVGYVYLLLWIRLGFRVYMLYAKPLRHGQHQCPKQAHQKTACCACPGRPAMLSSSSNRVQSVRIMTFGVCLSKLFSLSAVYAADKWAPVRIRTARESSMAAFPSYNVVLGLWGLYSVFTKSLQATQV